MGQIYEIRRPFRARVVKIVEMNARQALTFLTVSRPKCATVLRFCNTDVRKTKQNNDFKNENARSPYVFDGSKKKKTRSPCVFNGFQQKMTISYKSGAVFEPKRGEGTRDGVVNLCATLATEISSVSRSHTASHRTHERNETISR